MGEKLGIVGTHTDAEVVDGKDNHSRIMVKCNVCHTFAHAFEKEDAIRDLGKSACNPDCENCNTLGNSFDEKPAVPHDGRINDILHTCPYDGNRWWQCNSHFRLWKQVTSDSEWESLQKQY